MEGLDCKEWCKIKIKQASEDADLESFEDYSELLKIYENKKATTQETGQ